MKTLNEIRVIVKAVNKLENKQNLTFGAFFDLCNSLRESEGLAPVRTLTSDSYRNWINRVAKTLGNNEASLVLKSSEQSKDFNIVNKTTVRAEFAIPLDRSKTQIAPQVKGTAKGYEGQTFTLKGRGFVRKKKFEISPELESEILSGVNS